MPAVTVNSLSDISCRCCSSRLRCLQSITLESSRAVELCCLWHGFGNIVNAVERVEVHVALPQHVHLIAVPHRPDSLARLVRRTHARYAQEFNRRYRRSGHLWQSRFFSCALGLTTSLRHWPTSIATRCARGWSVRQRRVPGRAPRRMRRQRTSLVCSTGPRFARSERLLIGRGICPGRSRRQRLSGYVTRRSAAPHSVRRNS